MYPILAGELFLIENGSDSHLLAKFVDSCYLELTVVDVESLLAAKERTCTTAIRV